MWESNFWQTQNHGWLMQPKQRHVYFIQCGEFIKIGTAIDVGARIRSIRASNPHPIEVLKVMPADDDLEKDLHKRFATSRHRGEWFKPSRELSDLIANVSVANLDKLVGKKSKWAKAREENCAKGNHSLVYTTEMRRYLGKKPVSEPFAAIYCRKCNYMKFPNGVPT